MWDQMLLSGLTAAAEVMFPVNDEGIPDWQQTEVVERTLEYIRLMPPPQQRLVGLLYVGLELMPPATLGGLRRFSRWPPERRIEAIRAWRASRNPALKTVGDALKAQLTMMYLSHPEVMAHAGQFKTTDNPDDPWTTRVDPSALPGASA